MGLEPSGDPFNLLVQLEHERVVPRNPLINAGAILIADTLLKAHSDPVVNRQALIERQTGNKPDIDSAVSISGRATGFRNMAMANLMKSFGHLKHPVDEVLGVYFHQCSLVANCIELARKPLHFWPLMVDKLSPTRPWSAHAVHDESTL